MLPKIEWPEHWAPNKGWPSIVAKTDRMDWAAVHRQVDLIAFTQEMGRPLRRANPKDIQTHAGHLTQDEYSAQRFQLSNATRLYFPAVVEFRNLYRGTYWDVVMSGKRRGLPKASLDVIREVGRNNMGRPYGGVLYDLHRSRFEFQTGKAFPKAGSFMKWFGMSYHFAMGDVEKFRAFEKALSAPFKNFREVTDRVVAEIGRGNINDIQIVRRELRLRGAT